MKKICFIVAMQAEADPLIRHFGLKSLGQVLEPAPCRVFQGVFNELEITLVTNGKDTETGLDFVGCEAAVLTAQLALSAYRPDLLVNAGTAGGFASKGARVGDVYVSHRYVVFHDRRVDVPGWSRMGQGYYPCIDSDGIARMGGFKQGICTTGSSLDMIAEDAAQMAQTGGEIKDMEAAAIAWVAQLYRTPLLCVKSVTDLVGGEKPTPLQFRENLDMATRRLGEACARIVEECLPEIGR